MIDYHCHLLPGLDDGPPDPDEALKMAISLVTFGFKEVCCTPHCLHGHYELSPVEVREAVRKLQARLDGEGIALRLHPGMEYYLDEFFENYAANLLPLGGSRLVLCEAPPQAPPGLVAEMASLIVVQGYIPLIAHPERSEPVWELLEEEQEPKIKGQRLKVNGQPAEEGGGEGGENGADQGVKTPSLWRRLNPFKNSPLQDENSKFKIQNSKFTDSVGLPETCLFQANLGSFTGFYGAKPQRRAYELLQRGTYACFASDLHDGSAASRGLLELARDKVAFNPALQKLAAFTPPSGEGGSPQMAFW